MARQPDQGVGYIKRFYNLTFFFHSFFWDNPATHSISIHIGYYDKGLSIYKPFFPFQKTIY